MSDAHRPLRKAPFDGITEGWFYSDEERAIHGHETHFGVDFAAPRGTPVYAAADGLALASYHFGHATHTVGEQELPVYY